MTQEKINRINELARKSRISSLSEDELAEQKLLRDEYRAGYVRNLTSQLDNITLVEADGKKTPLKDLKREK